MDRALADRFQRASLGPRVLTAVVGIPLLFLALWAGGAWWVGLTAAVAILGKREFVHLHALPRSLNAAVFVLLVAGLVLFGGANDTLLGAVMLLWGIIIAAAAVWYFSPRTADLRSQAVRATLLGPVYLAAPMTLLARWRLEFTPWSVLAFLLVIWANDTAAYFVGIAAGRHKLAPRISPGKSWEGAVAGVVAGGLVGFIAAPLLGMRPVLGLVFGVLTTIASQIGDLFESAMKRKAGVKDSGGILPGHGGILDRFDGILVAAPIAYVMVRLWVGSR